MSPFRQNATAIRIAIGEASEYASRILGRSPMAETDTSSKAAPDHTNNELVGMDRTDTLSSVPQTQTRANRAASTEAERAGTSGTADRGRAGSGHKDEELRRALALDRRSDDASLKLGLAEAKLRR
jgi:hypothetical protein